MLTEPFFCIWRQVKIKHPQSTHASPWTKSRLLLQAVILQSDALGWHMKLLRQLQPELSGTHWQYQHIIFFSSCMFLCNIVMFLMISWIQSLQFHFTSRLNAPPFCHPCYSFSPLFLISSPSSDYGVSEATHRFNSSFMAHRKTTLHLIPFSLFLLWLCIKLEKILQFLSNVKSWLEPLRTIVIHSENEDYLRCWLDLS